jgi:hypothetical protein
MEFQPNPNDQYRETQQPLPNATAILVLGILSIVGCFCYSIPGFLCSIIALILAGKARALYSANPGMYTQGSLSNVNGGRICAIIGLILSSLYVIFAIIIIATMGVAALTDPSVWQSLGK